MFLLAQISPPEASNLEAHTFDEAFLILRSRLQAGDEAYRRASKTRTI